VRLLVRREPQEFALFHGILSRAHVSINKARLFCPCANCKAELG
jgi:hypothetical protein